MIAEINRVTLYGQVPVLEYLLLHEQLDGIIDFFHLLHWLGPTDSQAIAHSKGTVTDALRDTIDSAKLWHQVDHAVAVFYNEQRLVEVSDALLIGLRHVLSNTDFVIVKHELLLHRVGLEVNVSDDVGTLVAPVCNYARADNR